MSLRENEFGRVTEPIEFLRWIVDNGNRGLAWSVVTNIGCDSLEALSRTVESGHAVPGFTPRNRALPTAK